MKVLVTGEKNLIGNAVCKLLKEKNIDYKGITITSKDLIDMDLTKTILNDYEPTVIVHTERYSKVDEAEQNKEECMDINAQSTFYLSMYCQIKNIPMLFVSSNEVFDGNKPLDETYKIDDNLKPLNHFGSTMLMAEQEVNILEKYFIIRSSWVYGEGGHNFVDSMLKLSDEMDTISVVADQYSSPTYNKHLAEFIVDILKTDKYGTYHVTNLGYTNYADFARKIFELKDKKVEVIEITTNEYNNLADRPKNTKLDKKSLIMNGFNELDKWEDALKEYLNTK